MVLVGSMFRWFSRLLRRKKDQLSRYRTIVYSLDGVPRIIHDSLPDSDWKIPTPKETESDLVHCSLNTEEFSEGDYEFMGSGWLDINPATGLPMLPWGMDSQGNPYGANFGGD